MRHVFCPLVVFAYEIQIKIFFENIAPLEEGFPNCRGTIRVSSGNIENQRGIFRCQIATKRGYTMWVVYNPHHLSRGGANFGDRSFQRDDRPATSGNVTVA